MTRQSKWIAMRMDTFREAVQYLELVSEELDHLAAILHVYAGGLIFMK